MCDYQINGWPISEVAHFTRLAIQAREGDVLNLIVDSEKIQNAGFEVLKETILPLGIQGSFGNFCLKITPGPLIRVLVNDGTKDYNDDWKKPVHDLMAKVDAWDE